MVVSKPKFGYVCLQCIENVSTEKDINTTYILLEFKYSNLLLYMDKYDFVLFIGVLNNYLINFLDLLIFYCAKLSNQQIVLSFGFYGLNWN